MAPSVQRRKVWLTPTTRVPCSNAAKTRNPSKLPGVPQTNETISAASGPKFTILCGRVEDILLLNKFFRLFRKKTSSTTPQTLADVRCRAVTPYCKDMWRRYCCLKAFFPIVDAYLSCEDITRQSCCCIFSEPHAARFKPAS